jgi:hypothetical protein
MRTYLDCIPCFLRQALEALRENITDEDKILSAMRKVLVYAAKFDVRKSPPEMGMLIHRIVREESGCADPYAGIKKRSIEESLKVIDKVRDTINSSQDPLKTAARFSIAGNILDYAVVSMQAEFRLFDSLKKAVDKPLNDEIFESLRTKLEKASSVLIIGDNAGETVFDRLLIEQIRAPEMIYYGVKGSPVINDAVFSDAAASGLDEVSVIIENGSDAPGTILRLCSAEFKKVFRECSVVIAKGQANFETLNNAAREVFFLLQIKCPVIAGNYNYKVGDWVVTTAESGKGNKEQ